MIQKLGDFPPYSPVFGPRIAPLRRPGPLVQRTAATETGIPQRVRTLPDRKWALAWRRSGQERGPRAKQGSRVGPWL